MFKKFMKGIALVCVLMLVAGCTVKTYMQDRYRLDQVMKGNAGCLQGTCPERGDYKDTRETFVIEVQTKPRAPKMEETSVTEETIYKSEETYKSETYSAPVQKTVIYKAEESVQAEPVFQNYTIENGDTLQKISKKFYDTYKNWYKIYEANTDVISNPDRVKPGTVIRIPPK